MKKHLVALAIAAVSATASPIVLAQEMDHSTMDHGSMDHSAMDHGSMGGMDMNMQGGEAPPDARDPDGWSNGNTLHSGPYVLEGVHDAMEMGDTKNFAALLVDRLERTHSSRSNATSYDMQAWFGKAYNKLVVKAEGEASDGKVNDARTELLWSRAFATFWDTQLGVRNDTGHDRPSRNWLAFGVQGLAPYWFDVEATAYVGEHGRTAIRLAAEYEFLLTQRLILQPRAEANLYGKSDAETEVGSGLSSGTVGLRLRYEFSRQFAPYIGVERQQYFGNSADFAQAAGGQRGETRAVAGVRIWF